MAIGTGAVRVWSHDPKVWCFIFARYLPAFAVLSALWEIVQLPLYTLWWKAPPAFIAYAVLHCTLGDMLIGVGTLFLTLIITRSGALCDWHWILVGTVIVTIGFSYTVFSEWINTSVRESWTYSKWMPLIPFVSIGISPLLQWVIVPLAALIFARRVA